MKVTRHLEVFESGSLLLEGRDEVVEACLQGLMHCTQVSIDPFD